MVSQLAVITNAVLIAVTSNFVGFEAYRRGGYRDDYNGTGTLTVMDVVLQGSIVPDESGSDQGLSGYANWSSTVFEVSDLIDGSAFPAYSAQSLELLNGDGSTASVIRGDVKDNSPPLYLPFINFECLTNNFGNSNCTVNTTTVTVSPFRDETLTNITTFTEIQYEMFYRSINCRQLVFDVSPDDSPSNSSRGECFDDTATCR